jgi:hypothetical protein
MYEIILVIPIFVVNLRIVSKNAKTLPEAILRGVYTN